ncbi:EPIDERMAL PATTERNING FACTOR-like protein 2 [Rutidosis leptorrhynchoides]|uniref:EPIDERMAL PATTERNING FACTOR-like protein 2 n=1 Tax=Rutidosis leptorrhynchoides TaxID=125765 RepID=UPI003A9A65D5
MGCDHNPNLLKHFAIYILFLSISFATHFSYFAQGRMLVKQATHSLVDVEKAILRGQIGSRPPRCERRCGSCGHCEAIQVPTTPQTKTHMNVATIAYARGDYSSDYKPMSWKCKCGSFIFNP